MPCAIHRFTGASPVTRFYIQAVVGGAGTFSHELTFAKPGVRIMTFTAQHADHSESRNLRLDGMAHQRAG